MEAQGETRSEYADEEEGRQRRIWGGAPRENLRFAGQYLDREMGLHYNTSRCYTPDMGQFITPDPIGLAGGINLCSYAPNPLSWIDPLGLLRYGLTGNEIGDASNLPVVEPGTKEQKLAAGTTRNNGSGKPNFRIVDRSAAEKSLKNANPKIPEYSQYTGSKNYRNEAEYKHHPNESHAANTPENDLPYVKQSDYSVDKEAPGGGKGHIFYD